MNNAFTIFGRAVQQKTLQNGYTVLQLENLERLKCRSREVNCNSVRDLVGKPEGRDQLEDLDVDERITLP